MPRLGLVGAVFDDWKTVPMLSGWVLGLTEALPPLQALCAAVAGPNLLKNMTQLLCVEASEGEEPWSPSALDGSFPGLLLPGNSHKGLLSHSPRILRPDLCLDYSRKPQVSSNSGHHNSLVWAVSHPSRSPGVYFLLS